MTNKRAAQVVQAVKFLLDNGQYTEEVEEALDLAIKALEEQDRPTGHWIKGKEISRIMLGNGTVSVDYENFTCSICGLVLDNLLYHCDGSPFYKYCPNCGARMEVEEE